MYSNFCVFLKNDDDLDILFQELTIKEILIKIRVSGLRHETGCTCNIDNMCGTPNSNCIIIFNED